MPLFIKTYNIMPESHNTAPLGPLFRLKREEKGLLIRQVAAVTELDQAVISRIENGDRLPTREQVVKLAALYDLDQKEIIARWMAEKVVKDYKNEYLVISCDSYEIVNDKVTFSMRFLQDEGKKKKGKGKGKA
jgi:HTH-type transcriptional regulator, competence development regulator